MPSSTPLLWLAFAIAALFGAAARASNFCTMGAVADVVSMGSSQRLRMWALAVLAALLGSTALQAAGLIDLQRSLYAGSRLLWLSHLVGGLSFGIGMSLASGCTSKALIRLGGGNLKALIVLLVVGLSAYMTLHGLFAVGRSTLLDPVFVALPAAQTLPALLHSQTALAPTTALWLSTVACALLLALLLLHAARRDSVSGRQVLASLLIGLAIVAAWYVSGHLGYLAEHPDTLDEAFLLTASKGPEAFSFVAPTAHTLELLMLWTDRSRVLNFGIATALGVSCGAFLHALLTRSFRLEGFRDPADLLRHLAGALLMGFGGITALGCSIGQGISGLSALALGAFITTAAIITGCYLSLKLQYFLLMRSASR